MSALPHPGAPSPTLPSTPALTVPIADIIVGPRHRRDFGDLAALAASIEAEGLLQPIGVTADLQLVFGDRRLRACRDVLGRTEIEVRTVNVSSIVAGEYAENEVRKDFTPSERVAIAVAVREQLGRRHGGDRRSEAVQAGPSSGLKGETRDLAATRSGFDSGKQLERASNVVRLGSPKLVAAMDAGEVSITAAAVIARAAPDEQAAIVALEAAARQEELRRRREDQERVRASAREQEERTGATAYTRFLLKNGRLPSGEEAATIARLDFRETPSADGKRHSPVPPSTKEERARARLVSGYQDELYRTRLALQHLSHNATDPALLVEHASVLDREVINQHLKHARAWLNAFSKEWNRNG